MKKIILVLTIVLVSISMNLYAEDGDLVVNGKLSVFNQPSFLVRPSGAQTITADGEDHTVQFTTEYFDVGNNFSSNTFTAPIAGVYQFNCMLLLAPIDSGATRTEAKFRIDNGDYVFFCTEGATMANDGHMVASGSVIVKLDAGDTAIVEVRQTGGATKAYVADNGRFSGALLH